MADVVASLSSRLAALAPDAAVDSTPTEATPPAPSEAASETPAAQLPMASDLIESLSHEVQVTLADQQQDPNSPLFSAKSFEDLNLHPNLLKGVYKMGFSKPSKIQERALPLLLQNPPRNMIGQSQSGTGKTAAFALTMLSRVDMDLKAPQAICVAPSRELALQILSVVQRMGEYTPVECFHAGKDAVKRGMPPVQAQIIVGTPGTFIDMVTRTRVLDLKHVKVFVLDEADSMLDLGSMSDQAAQVKKYTPFRCRVECILVTDKLFNNSLVLRANKDVQIVLFSATFNDRVGAFASRFAPAANEIRLKKEEVSLDAIKQFFMDCSDENQKFEVLVELYSLLTVGQSIIFCHRRETADEIGRRMTAEGHQVTSLHGKLEVADRDAVMESFRDGKTKVLITTNVIARGIDVLQVNMVVNYDLPLNQAGKPDPETYLHRIGRTGRFGRQGISINFVHDKASFEDMEVLRKEVRVDTTNFEQMEKTLKLALKQ
ncbi:hypothetical protein RQP46_004972 [Phenoliferia psychrophenolica]